MRDKWASLFPLFAAIIPQFVIGQEIHVPPNSVLESLRDLAVLDPNGPFRNSSQRFEPTANITLKPPYFQIFDEKFLEILGPTPSVRVIVENDTFAFAHEAPMWLPGTDEVFFNGGKTVGRPVSKIDLGDLKNSPTGLINFTILPLGPDIQITNGGTIFKGDLLLVTTGLGQLPPSIVRVNPRPPFNDTVLLNNFYGRQFNSLNDIKIHPVTRAIFFTDVTYGFINGFRPKPLLPNQVYRFDPDTGEIQVVADGFVQPNGIAFSLDGQTAYIADTGASGAVSDPTLPGTIYAFDVMRGSQSFTNRRVFAYADTGVPDGLTLDTHGNVYAGCGDGTQVFSPTGRLLGKVFIGASSANMVFAGPGRLLIMADTKILLANIAAEGMDLNL
ncbi:D-lactonohydrolase-like protein [Collybia nuda]|uniref:D-lactonohydrolase-like protein n=1 Tax=Collybia nuda TaxID=64659 RepID=A0A9P5Y2U2_9AGAR|nr:D-lactonohydrolase-like protein [Collybia nuda]